LRCEGEFQKSRFADLLHSQSRYTTRCGNYGTVNFQPLIGDKVDKDRIWPENSICFPVVWFTTLL
jgi:hypothetical protein